MRKITVRAWFSNAGDSHRWIKVNIDADMQKVLHGCSDIPYDGDQHPYTIYKSRIVIVLDDVTHLSLILQRMYHQSALTEILLADDEWYQLKKEI